MVTSSSFFAGGIRAGWCRLSIWAIALASISLPHNCLGGWNASEYESAITQARTAFDRGAFEESSKQWEQASKLARRFGRTAEEIDSLIPLSAAYRALGRQRLAVDSLNEAQKLAEKRGDRSRLSSILNAMGAAQTFSHQAEFAEEHLRKALDLARKEHDAACEASALNNLGILLAAQQKSAEAIDSFQKAAESARGADQSTLEIKARANLAESEAKAGHFDEARQANRQAIDLASRLPNSHEKAFDLARCGKAWELLFTLAPEHPQELRPEALKVYELSASTAEAVGDTRALSYALGYSGHLYEQEKKYAEALTLTRRAAFLAQQTQAPELIYRWAWQTARIDRAEGLRDEAIAQYRCAVRNLSRIRNDLSTRLGNANAHSSYREAVGDVYFELADLLLQRADGLKSADEIKSILREAQGVCEDLKSVELEDYFQDECINLLKTKTKAIENLAAGAAVIYLVPLPDRTEILITTAGHMDRFKAPVTAAELTATIRAFRGHLETRATEEYLEEAQRLYGWLIQPLVPLLSGRHVDTLVFIPDGALRTVPMAALHDGKKFLIEKYAIAVTPGLTLMEPTPMKHGSVSVMTNALTEAVQRDGHDYPALPYVKEEVAKIQQMYGGMTLLNQQFCGRMVQKTLNDEPFSIVHFASHGEFSGDASKTFLLTYDDRISLTDLERIIRPAQLRDKPVELLCLSACQTAAGDDRAALGLAGVAVKAGARSAMATLWYVNDEASTNLITGFYQELRDIPGISKAKALQHAQIRLLSNEATSHPSLWAPYLLIGNWL